jgi:hypothetical protein
MWTAPRTWVASETITTVMLNTHVRDNLLALLTQPYCKMTKAATQSIPNTSVDTLILHDTIVYNSDGMADTANNRMNINTAGKYLIGTAGVWATDATGFRMSRIKHVRGGTTTIIGEVRGAASSSNVSRISTAMYDCQVGDILQMYMAQSGGSALVIQSTSFSPFFWAFRVAT